MAQEQSNLLQTDANGGVLSKSFSKCMLLMISHLNCSCLPKDVLMKLVKNGENSLIHPT
jgi:hypothetical protein